MEIHSLIGRYSVLCETHRFRRYSFDGIYAARQRFSKVIKFSQYAVSSSKPDGIMSIVDLLMIQNKTQHDGTKRCVHHVSAVL